MLRSLPCWHFQLYTITLSVKDTVGKVGLVVEAGDVWEVHHFACLLGFGATAINPYLALSTIRDMRLAGKMQTDLDVDKLKKNYIKAVCEGLLKVFSKDGYLYPAILSGSTDLRKYSVSTNPL